MKKDLDKEERSRLYRRLQSHLDYYIALLLWGLFFFSIISVWAVGVLDPDHGGLTMVLQVGPIYLFFPLFATFGMVSDRILVKELLENLKDKVIIKEGRKSAISKEDIVRISSIILLIFVSLPWLAARLGLDAPILFFHPVHVGENHGWIGVYMLLSVILISKTERLYLDSIFKEISIYVLCFMMLWGFGLMIEDFTKEQFNSFFPFLVWGTTNDFWWGIILQIAIVAVISLPIYYFGWCKYYKKRING
jgi:hypothetical protein